MRNPSSCLILLGLLFVLATSCNDERRLEKLIEQELATGVRNDSLFLGLGFGITMQEFYSHCQELNRKGLVKEGSKNMSVEYIFEDSLGQPIAFNFYADRESEGNIYRYFTSFNYYAFALNPHLYADQLIEKIPGVLMEWYGGNKPITVIRDNKKYIYKIDGNRMIEVFIYDLSTVAANYYDLSNVDFFRFHRMKQLAIPLLIITLLVQSCGDSKGVLFERVDPLHSGIHFSNDLTYDPDFNIFRYRNYYNGGGVGLIDFNQDGLLDIYLVANMDTNRLYQNLGDFKFKEVTHHAGVSGSHGWSTGVTIADVNADGWPDIYLCNSGSIAQDTRENELFINNGDGTFTEEAFKYGLADAGYSIHSSFFDYDKDGDLDMYLLNNSYKAIGSF